MKLTKAKKHDKNEKSGNVQCWRLRFSVMSAVVKAKKVKQHEMG